MSLKQIALATIITLFFLVGCKDGPEKKKSTPKTNSTEKEVVPKDSIPLANEDDFLLTEENAIEFFFNYQKNLKVNKVKITTSLGSFVVQLYDNVPYHKANFIFLTRKGYFNNTQFHRIVKSFIIQGGNADDEATPRKRREIGRYLLPPDTKKGHKHHRGTLSMPSSNLDNPHKLASPYEFFIVVTKPGSYHLDGNYTPFGSVISGIEVVDKINAVETGKGDWPSVNVYIKKAEVIE